MRLIDADALTKKIKGWMEYCEGYTDIVHEIMHGVFVSVVYDINDAPTIDAAPVRRGEWVTDDDNTDDWAEPYCNKCSCFIPCGPAHFCPNCGADMRGETHGTD